ncbi:PAAR domain-containing protein [Pendulispora brunnea]|uniref:PAAR domain-containing protein n=1 Tax=Pendulispora brunnea TaxID=2905690 RepID=A0ABZ2KKG7_9BACT
MSWQSFTESAMPALTQNVESAIAPFKLASPSPAAGGAAGAGGGGAGGGGGGAGSGAGGGGGAGSGGGEQTPPRPPNALRKAQDVAGAAMGLLSLPIEMINTGVAMATAQVAALFPHLPAATMGSMYVAPPHGHTHPPSFTPPATPAPVPLPSFGVVLLGCTIKVLINYIPAARAGDIGLALTCVGLLPMFEIKTGSSQVFIGGMRAARMLDFAQACFPSEGGPVRAALKGMLSVGTAVGVLGIAADIADAKEEPDPEMQKADAIAAAIDAAAMAVDTAAMAISASMGSDMAVPPTRGVLLTGAPNVLIGGFPMPNIPDPMQKLIRKIKGKFKKKTGEEGGGADMPGGCRCRAG